MEGATAVERAGGGEGVDWAVGWVEALARVMAVVMMAVVRLAKAGVETVAERAVKVLAEVERAVVEVMTAMAAAVKA